LFLVGEVRRDIIPKTLMDERLPVEKRVGVEELVVYETGVMDSFEGDFENVVRGLEGDVWVVVFSPTGCEAMLRVLGLGPFAGTGTGTGKRVFVATIGPTTRDHLREKFGFEAHVCAPRPSPEGVLEGIEAFMCGV
jgi:uroporphyrinogen-III synthase